MPHDGVMQRRTFRTRRAVRRHRRHGAPLREPDRRALELDGWRTTLEYRENHRRGSDGRLLGVRALWFAEAERAPSASRVGGEVGRGVDVIWATADGAEAAWSRLRLEAELADVRARDTDATRRATGSS